MPEPLPAPLPASAIAALLAAMAEIAADAGAIAAREWGGTVAAWDKKPGEIVTAVDLAVDRFLHEQLCALDPQAGWLSEESAASADRLTRGRCWVVDPIDGTRDFVHGRTGWGVCIALVENGHPVAGVIEAPARGERWQAMAGGGAFRNGLALHCAPRTDLVGARVPADALPRIDRDLVAVPKPNGIALRIALVAAGEADLVATTRWGHEWDIAAAVLIAAEAGARVTDAFGQPMTFNQPRPRLFGVLACSPGLWPAAFARFGVHGMAGR